MTFPKTPVRALRRWLPPIVLAGVFVSVTAAALLIVRQVQHEAMGHWGSRIQLAADDRRESIERALLRGMADARTIAAYPTAVFLAAGSPDVPLPFPPEQGARAHLEMLLASYVEQQGYRSVWVLGRSGAVLASVGSPATPPPECLAHALRSMSSADLHPEIHQFDGTGSLSFVAPVQADTPWAGSAKGLIGVVLVEANPRVVLSPLLREGEIGNRTGEVVLARQEGDQVVSLLPTRLSPNGFRLPATTARLASTAALGHEATFGVYEDYRGRPVLAAIRPLRPVPWGLVVKVDRSEALAPAYREAASTMAVALALMLGAAGLGYGVWRGRHARHEAQRRIEQGEKRWLLRGIEQSPLSIVVTDTSGAIRYVNPRFSAISGYTAEEVLGRNPRLLKSGQTPPEVYRALWDRITAGGEWRGEMLNRRKDGTLFWEEASISGVRDEDGRVTHYVAIKEDITARKEAERALREAQDQLLQSAKLEAVGKLAGGVAHDFNNLLGVILGYADMLARSFEPGDARRRRVEQIRKASQRGAVLTRQLLAFSRRQILQPRPVDLAAAVNDMDNMLRRLIGENIELVASAPEGEAVAMVDRGQMDQVLMNLVLNARDAMPRGGRLTVSAAVVQLRDARAWSSEVIPDGPYASLRVRDTGTGMTPDVLERIFEPFFTTKPSGEGTGLGLSTVYGIVKQSGGYVTVESVPGAGSTFAVYLPLLRQPAGETAPEPPAQAPLHRGSETVLLVEDQEALRRVTAELLAELGYKVLEATSGEEALELAVTHTAGIDVLVTDVVMSRMSGLELAEALRRRRPALRVLFISGHPDAVMARHGPVIDASSLLQKPFGAEALAERLRETLDAVAPVAPPAAN